MNIWYLYIAVSVTRIGTYSHLRMRDDTWQKSCVIPGKNGPLLWPAFASDGHLVNIRRSLRITQIRVYQVTAYKKGTYAHIAIVLGFKHSMSYVSYVLCALMLLHEDINNSLFSRIYTKL